MAVFIPNWLLMEQKLLQMVSLQVAMVTCFSSYRWSYADVLLLSSGDQLGIMSLKVACHM